MAETTPASAQIPHEQQKAPMSGAAPPRTGNVERDPNSQATEPAWYLRCLPYQDYRHSNWWRSRREQYTELVVGRYGALVCELCMASEMAGVPYRFHVHHITYARLGEELADDLRLLCSACHNLVHFPQSQAARSWSDFWAEHDQNPDPDLAERAQVIAP